MHGWRCSSLCSANKTPWVWNWVRSLTWNAPMDDGLKECWAVPLPPVPGCCLSQKFCEKCEQVGRCCPALAGG